ncbi:MULTISPECIES: hypothetical protein [Exiguobacterium]|uniref:Uncharacterized protein n=1 Tax=Exiguobacterium chiriqhucha RW-2 TaxID=1345023 RepID=U1LZM5_9BACL|nr:MULTISPECIES: hypothetical protein [Exiguobacterium]ERG68204.1 hypothetical protein M467_13055 [Exiguobacterium chiriqhucha RW-2]
MNELTRENIFLFMINNIDEVDIGSFSESNYIKEIYEINLIVLNEIEEKFYSSTPNFNIDLINQLEINITNIEDLTKNNNFELSNDLIKKLITDLTVFNNNNYENKMKSQNLFNKLLKILMDWSDKALKRKFNNIRNHVKSFNDKNYKKIFLSYAFEDHLYTLALFYYFYSNQLYLYVDWLINDEIPKTDYLKRNLFDNLSDSEQLLFLQSPNMELNIQGNPSIKAWCAWELGSFFYKTNSQFSGNPYNYDSSRKYKFFINIYRTNASKSHRILEGLTELSGISPNGLT